MSSTLRQTSYASVAAGTATPTSHQISRAPSFSQRDEHTSSDSTPQHSRSHISTIDMEGMDMDRSDVDPIRGRFDSTDYGSASFTPSYLRRSRLMERLGGSHIKRKEQPRDTQKTHNGLGSRQQSSSNLVLARSPPTSHRGVYHDIVERSPPHTPERTRPIPTRWNEHDKCNGIDITGNGLDVRFQGVARTPDDAAAVRADHPIPDECGLYYYEVTVMSKGNEGLIGVGFSGLKPSLSRLPGWEEQSWGYHGDDGYSFASSATGKPYGPKFAALDTIGCGINFRTGSAFFTKNGILLGDAFHDITTTRLYPSVGIKKPGEQLRANFGQTPFVFDIDDMMERERRIVLAQINESRLPTQPPLLHTNETDTINELIAQYLAHEGFTATGEQFALDVQEQKSSLDSNGTSANTAFEAQDSSAAQRQQIRSAILTGDIDKAFKGLSTYFPRVLEADANRDIYFRLRCRKFIEMILRSYEVQTGLMTGADGATAVTNGHGKGRSDTNGDGMELDGHNGITPEGRLDTMEMSIDDIRGTPAFAETKSAAMLHNDLLNEAIQYGMGLQAEFNQDPRKDVQKALSDTFALIAYTDARESGLAEMMEGRGRVDIAEQVNGAILVSLGKPRSALLEQLCGQTEVLLEMLSSQGGAASFVNLQRDYLQ